MNGIYKNKDQANIINVSREELIKWLQEEDHDNNMRMIFHDKYNLIKYQCFQRLPKDKKFTIIKRWIDHDLFSIAVFQGKVGIKNILNYEICYN